MKKKWNKASIIITIILAVLGAYLVLPVSVVRAEEKVLGTVDYNSIVLEGSYYAYSNNPTQYYSSINVNPDAGKQVTKVILREKATKAVVRELSKTSGNEYGVGNIDGEKIHVAYEVADTWDGTWNWWRDSTNPKVWMYDLNNRYYFLQSGIYDQPQPNAKKQVLPKPSDNNSPLPSFSGAEEVSDGNIGWAESTKALPSIIYGDGQTFEVSKLANLKANYEYFKKAGPYISPSNILAVETQSIDLTNLQLTFRYKARFVDIYQSRPFGSQGLINEYRTSWKVSLSTDVYKYPQMEIVYYQEPNGTSPSPTPVPSNTPSIGNDLSVDSITFDPSCFTIRDEVTYTVKMKNNGGTTVSNVPYTVTLNGYSYISDKIAGTWKPGETKTVTFKRKEPNTMPSTIVATVNPNGAISESNMTNNAKTLTTAASLGCGGNPVPNDPPNIKIQWFDHWGDHTKPVDTVIQGTIVDLRVTEANDPDGDSVSYYTDFAGSSSPWIRSLPDTYHFESAGMDFNGINTDTTGYHAVTATITDVFGAKASSTASLTVIPPNPVPVITGPSSVVEGRPLPTPFSAANSYSPLGRKIDHSKDEWGNLKEHYDVPGKETITLEVTDDAGMHSLPEAKATHSLTVLPDLPPIPDLLYSKLRVRGSPTEICNTSYSPDGDQIIISNLSYKYDSDNDGSYDDEMPVSLSFDDNKVATINTLHVGKYRLYLYVQEDWGRSASKEFDFEVINDSPTVSFKVTSENQIPSSPGISVQIKPEDLKSSKWQNNVGAGPWVVNSTDNSIFLTQVPGVLYEAAPTYSSLIKTESIAVNNQHPTWRTDIPLYNGYKLIQTAINISYPGPNYNYKLYLRDQLIRDLGSDYKITLDKFRKLIYRYNGATEQTFTYDQIIQNLPPVRTISRFHATMAVSSEDFYGGEILDNIYNKYKYRFNTDYKLAYTMFNAQNQQLGNDYTENFPVSSFMKSTSKTYYQDLQQGAFFCLNPADSYSDGTDYRYTPVTHWLGNDSAGNVYYESYQKASSICSNSVYYSGSGLSKLNGNDGSPMTTIPAEGTYQGKLVGNAAGDKFAYTYNTGYDSMLAVRNSSDSSLVKSVRVDAVSYGSYVELLGRYKNSLVVRDNLPPYKLKLYDFDTLALQWEGSFSNQESVDGITADGYLVHKRQDYVGGIFLNKVFRFNLDTKVDELLYSGTTNYQKNEEGKLYTESPTSIDYYEMDRTVRDNMTDFYGQFTNPTSSMANFNLNYKMKYDEYNGSVLSSGFGFRIQDQSNMYRIEFSNDAVRLVMIQNGHRTVLGESPVDIISDRYYAFRVMALGPTIKVYVDGVPLINIENHTFTTGQYGPYANIAYTRFKDMSISEIINEVSLSDNTGIVDKPIIVTSTFDDTEHDPKIPSLTFWHFEHVNPNKFLDAGDGKSGLSTYHNKTFTGPLASLDKVGVYQVKYREIDDPHELYRYPSGVFAGYRQYSNEAVNTVIIHRAPLAPFTLSLNTDGTVVWNDQSYDPDRWLSPSNYSTESPEYATNMGIYSHKYKYTTPSGSEVNGKLIRPTETGLYTISQAVMDEYGAWSDWYDQTITATIALPPNNPPIPDFDRPATVYRDTTVQLTNKTIDPDGDALTYSWRILKPPFSQVFSSAVNPSFVIRNFGLGKDAVSTNWFIELTATDSKGDSASVIKSLTVLNQTPSAEINGPAIVNTNTTQTYTTGSSDPDPDDRSSLTYNWKLIDPDGEEQTWTTANVSIPFTASGYYRLEHYVVDQLGAISNTAVLNIFVNTPPSVELMVPSGVDAAHPSVNIPPFQATWTYVDPEQNKQLEYHFRIYENGASTPIIDAWGKNSNKYYDVPEGVLSVGKLYYAVVQASDGYAWSKDSQPKYFVLNRPPVADFDWNPNPVYEGDTVALVNSSHDPDGDTLTSHWSVTLPDGAISSNDTTDVTTRWTQIGNYSVSLTVTDPYGASGQVTKTITVLALSITGHVGHTDTWNENRAKFNARQVRLETDAHRNDDEFWAGEAFILAAETTDTGTATHAVSVEVQAEGDPVPRIWPWYFMYNDMESDNASHVMWNGRINNPDADRDFKLEQLSDGPIDFTFTATYSNGTIKQDVVRVYIRNKWTEYWQIHRAW